MGLRLRKEKTGSGSGDVLVQEAAEGVTQIEAPQRLKGNSDTRTIRCETGLHANTFPE